MQDNEGLLMIFQRIEFVKMFAPADTRDKCRINPGYIGIKVVRMFAPDPV